MLVAITGKAVEPYEPEEFYTIQIAFLERFKSSLEDIRKYISENASSVPQPKKQPDRLIAINCMS